MNSGFMPQQNQAYALAQLQAMQMMHQPIQHQPQMPQFTIPDISNLQSMIPPFTHLQVPVSTVVDLSNETDEQMKMVFLYHFFFSSKLLAFDANTASVLSGCWSN